MEATLLLCPPRFLQRPGWGQAFLPMSLPPLATNQCATCTPRNSNYSRSTQRVGDPCFRTRTKTALVHAAFDDHVPNGKNGEEWPSCDWPLLVVAISNASYFSCAEYPSLPAKLVIPGASGVTGDPLRTRPSHKGNSTAHVASQRHVLDPLHPKCSVPAKKGSCLF